MAQTEATSTAPAAGPPAPAGTTPVLPKAARRRQRRRLLALHLTSLTCLILIWWLITEAGLDPAALPAFAGRGVGRLRPRQHRPPDQPRFRPDRARRAELLPVGAPARQPPADRDRRRRRHRGRHPARPADGHRPGSASSLEPYLNFLRSLPPLAYIGLLIVWFGIGDTSKIWLLFLAAFPPIAMATISGVRGVREDQVNAVLSLGASRRQVPDRRGAPGDAAGDPHRHPGGHRVRLDHRRGRRDRQRHPRHRRPRLPRRRAAAERRSSSPASSSSASPRSSSISA